MAKEWREFVIWVPAGIMLGGIIGTLIGVEYFDNPHAGGGVGVVVGAVGGIALANIRGNH